MHLVTRVYGIVLAPSQKACNIKSWERGAGDESSIVHNGNLWAKL